LPKLFNIFQKAVQDGLNPTTMLFYGTTYTLLPLIPITVLCLLLAMNTDVCNLK